MKQMTQIRSISKLWRTK